MPESSNMKNTCSNDVMEQEIEKIIQTQTGLFINHCLSFAMNEKIHSVEPQMVANVSVAKEMLKKEGLVIDAIKIGALDNKPKDYIKDSAFQRSFNNLAIADMLKRFQHTITPLDVELIKTIGAENVN